MHLYYVALRFMCFLICFPSSRNPVRDESIDACLPKINLAQTRNRLIVAGFCFPMRSSKEIFAMLKTGSVVTVDVHHEPRLSGVGSGRRPLPPLPEIPSGLPGEYPSRLCDSLLGGEALGGDVAFWQLGRKGSDSGESFHSAVSGDCIRAGDTASGAAGGRGAHYVSPGIEDPDAIQILNSRGGPPEGSGAQPGHRSSPGADPSGPAQSELPDVMIDGCLETTVPGGDGYLPHPPLPKRTESLDDVDDGSKIPGDPRFFPGATFKDRLRLTAAGLRELSWRSAFSRGRSHLPLNAPEPAHGGAGLVRQRDDRSATVVTEDMYEVPRDSVRPERRAGMSVFLLCVCLRDVTL